LISAAAVSGPFLNRNTKEVVAETLDLKVKQEYLFGAFKFQLGIKMLPRAFSLRQLDDNLVM